MGNLIQLVISHLNHGCFLPMAKQITRNFMVLKIAPKLIQSHGWISIKAQLELVNRIEIDKNQQKYRV